MPIIGIIAEYNPFHNGHIYQIREIRRQYPEARIVVVLSGAFTQRGLPAILDKWTRAACACAHGVDLVVELPAVFAVRSAQDFARGGIALLHRLGCVDYVAFGTESPLPQLSVTVSALDDVKTQEEIRRHIRTGDAYAAAIAKALSKESPVEASLLRTPNNILAIEYLRSLQRLQCPIEPLAIRRASADHNEARLQSAISSATSIRHACQKKPAPWDAIRTTVPIESYDALRTSAAKGYPSMDVLYHLLVRDLLTRSDEDLCTIAGITEGIEHRLRQAAKAAQSYGELVESVQTRRFPYSRVQRLLSCTLLRLTKEDVSTFDRALPLYVRPLAFKRSTPILSRIKETCSLPIVDRIAAVLPEAQLTTKAKDGPLLRRMLCYDLLASDLQTLAMPAIGMRRRDYLQSPTCL